MTKATSVITGRGRVISGVVSTDDIIAGRYKHAYTDPAKLAPHVFEAFAPGFAATLEPGDIIIADAQFGIGSSREQAVTALMATGVVAVVAPIFGRIFFRNCWNLGLPAIELDLGGVEDYDAVAIDFEGGLVAHGERRHEFPPPAPEILAMWRSGGLLATIK